MDQHERAAAPFGRVEVGEQRGELAGSPEQRRMWLFGSGGGRGCRLQAVLDFTDARHESKAVSAQRLDHVLLIALVVRGLAREHDRLTDRRVAHRQAVPHCRRELVACHRPRAVLDQVEQRREDTRRHELWASAPAQLQQRSIELELSKSVDHGYGEFDCTANRADLHPKRTTAQSVYCLAICSAFATNSLV